MSGSGPKISVLWLLLIQLFSGFLYGQEREVLLTIHAGNIPLEEVMEQIETQSGLSFSFNSRLVDTRKEVALDLTGVSLDSALTLLFRDERIRFEVVERQIVLKRERRMKVDQEKGTGLPGPEGVPVRFTISGYVKDGATGEVLIGATITIPGGLQGTITNEYGFYSLTLTGEAAEMYCSYIGYRLQVLPVEGSHDQTLHFSMEKEAARLSEVTVYSNEPGQQIRSTRSSEERIQPESVRNMPALFGEKDVIKSLAAIPGIKFFGDGSTIFYVRGGGRDQNMITLDEAPIYNPTHLLGFFSTILPDAVKDVKIYKGDFPANYGGRLSSLIDVRTKDGNMKRFGVDGSIGLLSSRLSLEGPIWKDHISFFISGRRSYITRPLQAFNENLKDLHFSDLHVKVNYNINPKNRIFFSMYRGEDNFEQRNNSQQTSGINWKNSTTTIRWNHLYTDRLFSNLTIFGSVYEYLLNTHLENNDFWKSHIDNLSLKYDFTWYAKPDNTFRFGFLSAVHFFNPGNYYVGGEEFDPGLDLSTKRTREFALYASDQFIINDVLSIRAGMRFTLWQNRGPATEYSLALSEEGDFVRDSLAVTEYPDRNSYYRSVSLDPRISLVYQPGRSDMVKLSYSRTSQFQYLITNSISPFTSLEVWLPAGPNVSPQVAHQLTTGYSRRFGNTGMRLGAELYYKLMKNLIDYRDHARMLMNPLVEYELRFGEGKAWGVELILNKDTGPLNGWISYTWSRAISRVEEINNGDPYPAYSDRPHDFSIYLSWSPHPRITLTGNFIYMTGAPFTTPTGFYVYDNHQVPIYAERNNDRLPDYHRLDVALNWHLSKPGRKYQHELILSAYNLYNRKNPVALHFNKIEQGEGTYVVPYDLSTPPELVSTQFYLYGIVPSISYHFKF